LSSGDSQANGNCNKAKFSDVDFMLFIAKEIQ